MAARTLTYATVCSGVECCSAAVADLPMRPVFFSEIEPFPCAVLKFRYPNVPNLGDMGRIRVVNDGKEITNGRTTVALPDGGLDVFAGGTPCFAAGTMVLTPSGYRPIETLAVGDEVVSGSGHVRMVEAVGSKMSKVGRLKVLGRPEIVCTPNHPFFCVDMKTDNRRKSETYGKKIPAGDYAVTRADESVGKYVGRVSHWQMTAHSVAYPKCGDCSADDVMELAGWYLGDGYVRRFNGKSKKAVMFALCSERKIREFRKRFGKLVHVTDCGGKQCVYCTALADWLVENFGEHSDGKRIPYWCYGRENTHRLLRGYAATDGWTQGNEQKFCTVSPALAYGIADLLGSASVHLQKVSPKGRIQGREVNQRDCYQVKSTPNTIRTKYVNGRFASIVRSFNGADDPVRVYNIAVADEHTYVANGLWTHNCQDVSAAGLRRGMAEGSGTRSSLAFEFARLVGELRPRWVVWENVAGVLSDPNFPGFLSALAERGYGVAYRTLDAQWVRCADIHHADGGVVRLERAVPQRRRRVWVVGRLGGDVGEACEVLFEREGLAGDNPPRRKPGQGAARPSADGDGLAARMVGAAAVDVDFAGRGHGTPFKRECSFTVNTNGTQGVAAGFDPYEPGGVKSVNADHAGTVVNGTCPGCHNAVVRTFENHAADSRLAPIVVAPTMGASRHANASSDNPLVVSAFENHAQDARVRPCGDSSPTIGASNLNGPSCNNPLVVTEGTCA